MTFITVLCYLRFGEIMNDEMFRQSLIELTDNDLLNDFVNGVLGYDLRDDEYVYIQYKIVHNDIFLNIYDNNDDNRFKAICFTENEAIQSDRIKYIDINMAYYEYKTKKKINKMFLIGALLKTKEGKEKKEIINSLFDDKMKDIFLKHFI